MPSYHHEQRKDLVVPRELVKTVKTALEEHGLLDKSRKISAREKVVEQPSFAIPILRAFDDADDVLKRIGLSSLSGRIHLQASLQADERVAEEEISLHRCIELWLDQLSPEECSSISKDSILQETPSGYSIYPPMLLLPPNAFSNPTWKALAAQIPLAKTTKLHQSIASAFRVTHIAITRPIPPSVDDPSATSAENNLRSPINLTPLHGDFGPPGPISQPTAADFSAAFWVSTRQNRICQTWAPRHSMFSRGNIKEKARLLSLPSVREARCHPDGFTAVDLYAGIGYFAFPYARAGADLVLCFEINPWSVEGLRRGASANGWSVEVHKSAAVDIHRLDNEPAKPKLVVYELDNRFAKVVVTSAKNAIPPVRHVNCGLLPTSQGSWDVAVSLIDHRLGGWIHVHENLAIKEIQSQAQHIRDEIQRLACTQLRDSVQQEQQVILEHIERVKTYAPGVMHCVLDMYIAPTGPS